MNTYLNRHKHSDNVFGNTKFLETFLVAHNMFGIDTGCSRIELGQTKSAFKLRFYCTLFRIRTRDFSSRQP